MVKALNCHHGCFSGHTLYDLIRKHTHGTRIAGKADITAGAFLSAVRSANTQCLTTVSPSKHLYFKGPALNHCLHTSERKIGVHDPHLGGPLQMPCSTPIASVWPSISMGGSKLLRKPLVAMFLISGTQD